MKSPLLKNLMLAVTMILTSMPSLASMAVRDAQIAVRDSQRICPELTCPDSRAQVKALSAEQIKSLDPATQKFLRAAAKTFAENQWPDTILENAYEVDFKVRLEAVEVLVVDDQSVGYRVSFSSPAWNRDECPVFTEEEMDQKSVEELVREKCKSGRIHDRNFAVPNPTGIFDDEQFRAEFKVPGTPLNP